MYQPCPRAGIHSRSGVLRRNLSLRWTVSSPYTVGWSLLDALRPPLVTPTPNGARPCRLEGCSSWCYRSLLAALPQVHLAGLEAAAGFRSATSLSKTSPRTLSAPTLFVATTNTMVAQIRATAMLPTTFSAIALSHDFP